MQKGFFLKLLKYDWWVTTLMRLIYVVFVLGFLLPSFSEQGSSVNNFFRDSFFLFLISVLVLSFSISEIYNKKKNNQVSRVLLVQESKPLSWFTAFIFLALIAIMVILYFQIEQYSQLFLLGGVLLSLELIEEIRNRLRKEDELLCSSEQFIRLPSNRNRVIMREIITDVKLKKRRLILETERLNFEIKDVNITDEDVERLREIILSKNL